MTIWIINPFDNLPMEGSRPQRYWLMAEAFARAGHETLLWTQDWNHARKVRRLPTDETCGGSDGRLFGLRYVHVPGYRKNISLKRIWSHWRFARNWAAMTATCNPPQLIVVSSPPLFIGREVRRFCSRVGARYVVDIMDAWPETFERVVPRWMLKGLRNVARDNYRGASAVTAVARRYIDLARSCGAICPMHLCYHGIANHDGNVGSQSDASNNVALDAGAASVVRLAYIGNMSLSYDLSTVIDAVKCDDGLALDLAGAGPDEMALRRRAEGCGRIRFHGYLGETDLRALLGRADVGLVPMFDESCVGVPYKLADYVAAGLPVASSLHGETEELIARCEAGTTYQARDVAAFVRTVRNAVKKSAGAFRLAQLFDANKLYDEYVAFVAAL